MKKEKKKKKKIQWNTTWSAPCVSSGREHPEGDSDDFHRHPVVGRTNTGVETIKS